MPSATASRGENADRSVEMETGVGKGPYVRRCPRHGIRGRDDGHLTDDRLALYCGADIFLPT